MKTFRNAAAKPWIVMPVVAVLVLGGWFFFRPDNGASNASAQETDQVVEATVGDMALAVSAEGTVAAADTDDLSFTSAGTVTAVNVEAGQTVAAGDVLATLDSAELEADVADAEASVADAEAALEDDEAAGASDAQLTADQSSLTAAEDRLAAAEKALAGAQLVASFDGTVAAVNVTVGEELSSGGVGGTSSTGTGSGSGQSAGDLGSGDQGFAPGGTDTEDTSTTSEAHVQIVSTSSFTVELGFDDTDIANLAEGQEVTVTLSTSSGGGGAFGFPGGGAFPGGLPGGGAFPGAQDTEEEDDGTTTQEAPAAAGAASVTGEVVEVGQVADASSGVASYPVTVAFSDDSGDFNVGATVSVEITYDQVVDAVQVPSFAVTTTDGVSTVTVNTDSGEETRTVTTGLTEGTMVQITAGLQAGEEVIITLPEGLGGGGGGGQGGPPGFGAATEGGGS